MTAAAMSAWAELEDLRSEVTAAERQVEALEVARRQVATSVRAARQAELDYLRAVEAGDVQPDPQRQRALEQARAELEARVAWLPAARARGDRPELEPVDERLEARIAGARARLQRRREELEAFTRRAFPRLAAELAADAAQARGDVIDALPALIEAEARYRRVRARWRPILEAVGRPVDLPANPLRGFADDVDGWAGVPLPVPADLLPDE